MRRGARRPSVYGINTCCRPTESGTTISQCRIWSKMGRTLSGWPESDAVSNMLEAPLDLHTSIRNPSAAKNFSKDAAANSSRPSIDVVLPPGARGGGRPQRAVPLLPLSARSRMFQNGNKKDPYKFGGIAAVPSTTGPRFGELGGRRWKAAVNARIHSKPHCPSPPTYRATAERARG